MARLKKIKYNVHEHCLLFECRFGDWHYTKREVNAFLFESPLKTRLIKYNQVVNLTLPA